jgi:hypothetical protein
MIENDKYEDIEDIEDEEQGTDYWYGSTCPDDDLISPAQEYWDKWYSYGGLEPMPAWFEKEFYESKKEN